MKRLLAVAAAALLISACAPEGPKNTGVYLLLDTSGTYNEELKKAQTLILYILSRLQATDTFAVARIDTGSFSEKDIIAKITLDDRPTTANIQKRAFASDVKRFVTESRPAPNTDITGGLLQAIEFLNEKHTGRKTVLIFSDLREDLAKGYVRDVPLALEGFDVIALNVTKLGSDNVDPREYLSRVENWRERVEKGGGRWRMINDLERLDGLL